MRLGLLVNKFDGIGGAELALLAEASERAGISRLSVPDHYFQMEIRGRAATDPMLEGYTTLSYLAAHTQTIQLGMLVTGVTYRYPGLLAKVVTTLDVLSGGRAMLGLGAGWYEREHRGLGVPYPTLSERFARLEETIRICLQMWDPSNNGPFDGAHYQLAETICAPQPVCAPHPPILIGGSGERKTLRLVAQYADACHLVGTSAEIPHKLDVLRAHCANVGRDYADIEKTAHYRGESLSRGDVDQFVDELRPLAELGISQITVVAPDEVNTVGWIDACCAAAVPRLAELG